MCACQKPAEARLAAGDSAAREGRWAEARAAFQEASELAPSDPLPLTRLGFARWRLGEHAGAAEAWARARSLSPDFPDAKLGEALVAIEAGDAGAALLLLADANTPLGLLSRARAALLQGGPGDAALALEAAQAAAAIDDGSAEALYLTGSALVALGRYADAQAAFEQLAQRHPASPLAPYGLARLAAAQERAPDALLHLTAARRVAGTTWDARAVAADPAFAFLSTAPEFKALLEP